MNNSVVLVGDVTLDTLHLVLVGVLIVTAALIVWLLPYRNTSAELKSRLSLMTEDLKGLDHAHDTLEREHSALLARTEEIKAAAERERQDLAARLTSAEEQRRTVQMRLEDSDRQLEAMRVRDEERKATYESERKQLLELRAEVETKFSEIAHAALSKSQKLFLETANESFAKQKETAQGDLKTLVSPLREAIGKFETRVETLEKVRAEDKSAIFEQVKSVGEMLARNQAVTSKLVTALSSPKGGGRWGEESLRNVMEMAGLSEYADFTEQDGSGGDGLRPDVIIRMPGGREIVVDSKVSIDDFLRAAEESDEARRNAFLTAHARKLKDHVKRLASKEYWKAFESRVDFVAMYVPGENFYAAALQVERGLFDFAARNKVLIVTPSTLIALAKAVSYGWRQEEAAKNALEAAQMGRELHKRLSTFTDHMEKVGTYLGRSVSAFNKMNGSYERMVMPQARKFETLQLNESGTTLSDVTLLQEYPANMSAGLPAPDDEDEDKAGPAAAE